MTGAGVAFGMLGFILFVAAWGTVDGKWDSEDCCSDNSSSSCAICVFSCMADSSEACFEYDGCGYTIDADGPSSLSLVFSILGLVPILLTALILEFGDKFCCECCQKCTACLLAVTNALGALFLILVIVVSLTGASDDDNDGCDDVSEWQIFGVMGLVITAWVFMIIGIVCSIGVTFIECCCDDSDKGIQELAPGYSAMQTPAS